MAKKKCPTEDLDLANLVDCNAAIQSLLHSRQGLKGWFNKAKQECENVLDRFSQPLKYGDKAIQLTEKAFDSLEKYSPNLRDCNIKLKNVYTARLCGDYTETDSDKSLIADIDKNLNDCDEVYEHLSFDMQDLLDRQQAAKHGQRMAEAANRSAIDDLAMIGDDENVQPRPGKIIYKEQSSFASNIKISVNHSTTEFNNWEDDTLAYFHVSHAEVLDKKWQQKFVKKCVEPSFWALILDDITPETDVWPPEDVANRNGTSVMELLRKQHVKKHPQTIDRSKFFDYKQSEKQSDQRYIAEMRRLFDQNTIGEMSGDEILAYHVMKGLSNIKVKEAVLKDVKANDSIIDMDKIQEAINVQASLHAFHNFGNSQASCNKISDKSSSPDKKQGKQGKKDFTKGKGKGESGKKSEKLEFVDFKKLTGQDKLKAIKDRGFCPNCMKKKHKGSEECEAKGHVCKKCDKVNHLEKCCAFPKLKAD